MPSTGAGLASFFKWNINRSGPVMAAVIRVGAQVFNAFVLLHCTMDGNSSIGNCDCSRLRWLNAMRRFDPSMALTLCEIRIDGCDRLADA